MTKDKNGIDEYLSFTRHELRTQIAVTREGISQVLDGLGGGKCDKCVTILKPALECADKLEKMVGELLAASAFDGVLRKRDTGDAALEVFKKDLTAMISHLVRTPLAIAKEGLSLVLDEVPGELNDKQKKLLFDVKEAFDRLIRDVEKVLETPWEKIAMSDAEERKLVLVVDDEPKFLETIQRRLEDEGYNVATACNGNEALKKIAELKPDAVLLDVMMPELDGFNTLKKIRESDKTLPVFIITVLSDKESFEMSQKLDASGYMVKTEDLKKQLKNITGALNIRRRYRPDQE